MNDIKPLVSVVMPIYNASDNLSVCLKSLVRQTLRDTEIICVDDGSTDCSADIVRAFAARDSRITLFQQDNRGAGAARNRGFAETKGKYVIFLDSDDIFEEEMLEYMSAMLEHSGADACVCSAMAFDSRTHFPMPSGWINDLPATGQYAASEIHPRLFQMVQGWPWDKMFRADFLKNRGFSYPSLANSQDLVFIYAALFHAKSVYVTNRVLVHHRMNSSDSISSTRGRALSCPFDAVYMLMEQQPGLCACDEAMRSLYRWCMNFWIWHLETLSEESSRECYSLLKQNFRRLDFTRYEKSLYNPVDYRKYRRIRCTPYAFYRLRGAFRENLKKVFPMPAASSLREFEALRCAVGQLYMERICLRDDAER